MKFDYLTSRLYRLKENDYVSINNPQEINVRALFSCDPYQKIKLESPKNSGSRRQTLK